MYHVGASPVWDAGQYHVGASPIWDAGQYHVGASPVWDAGQYHVGTSPVWDAGQYHVGARPVWFAGCFPKSEIVTMAHDGYMPIGSLKIGDIISSWDSISKKAIDTAVTEIHEYRVSEIVHFNDSVRVSFCHPLMVMEKSENGFMIPKWKVACDVEIGDYIVGYSGKSFAIKCKAMHKYSDRVEVLNLSTDSGMPFIVGGCVVRAENALDTIKWADSPITNKLLAA